MINVSRRIIWVLLLLPALAGCPQEEPARKAIELPFAGQEVRIAIPADFDFRAAWEAPLNEWAAQSGARYSLIDYTPTEGSNPFAESSDAAQPTLAIFPLEQAGPLIAAGQLAAIPPSLLDKTENGIGWPDLFAGLRDKIASRKGQPQFIPLSSPVLVCYFRRDLLSAAGLSPPQTWEDYQQLLDTLANWAPGCTAVEPWSESFRATMFLARAVSLAQHPGQYSLYFDIETGEPLIDGPGFVRALEAARSALAAMPADVRRYNPADCRAELLQGRAALAIACEPLAGRSSAATGTVSDRKDDMQIGCIRLPGAREIYNTDRHIWEPVADKGVNYVTFTAFSGWGVGASGRNSTTQTEAGWNALLKACGADFTSGFPPGISGLCRESQLPGTGSVSPGLEPQEANSLAQAIAQSLRDTRLVADLPLAGRAEFRKALTRAVAHVIDESAAPEQALHDAAQDWRQLIEKLGPAKVRDGYRASLGLSPKPAGL
ncbi:MAG TPA: extracellular solute-binding protein [Planctomycetaceae bacterium]